MANTADVLEKPDLNTGIQLSGEQGKADNDNQVEGGNAMASPLVHAAAQSLIDHHCKKGGLAQIKAFDVPHEALVKIAEQLDELGASQVARDALIDALKEYVLSKGGSFARAANAKPIYIALEVSKQKPDFKYEDSINEMTAINGIKQVGAGAATIVRNLTYGGGSMTSSATGVDSAMEELRNLNEHMLWIQYEAPTKEDLEGNEAPLTAVAQAVGGAMGAAELKELMADLEEQGLLTSDLAALLENLIEIKALVEMDMTPEIQERIQELTEAIAEQMESGLESGLLPTSMATAIVESLSTIAETYDLGAVITPEILEAIETNIQVSELVAKMEALKEGLDETADADAIAEIDAFIEQIKSADGVELATLLSELPATFAAMNLPEAIAEQVAEITADAAELQTKVEAQLPDPSAENLLEILKELDSLEDLPPELQAIVDSLSEQGIAIADLTVEQLAAAIEGQGDPAIVAAVQDIVIALNDPDVQIALPQETLDSVNIFLRDNADIVEAVTVQAMIESLNEVLQNDNLSEDQLNAIKETIEKLENGEGLSAISPEVLESIKVDATIQEMTALLESGNLTPEDAVVIEQTLEALKEEGATTADIAPEALEIVQTQSAIETLTTLLENGDLTIEQIKDVKDSIAKLEAGEGLQSLDASIVELVAENTEPSVSAQIETIIQTTQNADTENIVLAQETLDKIDVVAENLSEIKESLESIKADGDLTPEQAELLGKIESVLETIQQDPANIVALAELATLTETLNAPEVAALLPADVKSAVENISQGVPEITATQETALAIKHDVTPEMIQDTAKIVSTMETAKESLAEAGIDVDAAIAAITADPTSIDAASEIVKLEAALDTVLNDPAVPDTVKEALQAEIAERIEAVKETQIEAIVETHNVEKNIAENIVETVAALESLSGDQIKAIVETGADPVALVEAIKADPTSIEAAAELAALNTDALPPQIAEQVAEIQVAQIEAIADKTGISVEAAQNVVNLAAVAATLPAEVQASFAEAGIDLPTIIENIKANPMSVETAVQIEQFKVAMQNASPEMAAAITSQLGEQGLQVIQEAQIASIAEQTGVSVEVAQQTIETITAFENAPDDVKQAMADAGHDVTKLSENPGTPEAMAEAAAILTTLQTMDNPPAELVAQAEATLQSNAQEMAKEIVANNPSLDIESVTATLVEGQKIAAVAENSSELAAVLERAGIEPERVQQIIQDLKDPSSAAALIAKAEIINAAPEAAAIFEAQGAELKQPTMEAKALVLNLEPAQLEAIKDIPNAEQVIDSMVEAAANAPDKVIDVTPIQKEVIIASLQQAIDSGDLSAVQKAVVEKISKDIQSGRDITAKDVAVLQTAAQSDPTLAEKVQAATAQLSDGNLTTTKDGSTPLQFDSGTGQDTPVIRDAEIAQVEKIADQLEKKGVDKAIITDLREAGKIDPATATPQQLEKLAQTSAKVASAIGSDPLVSQLQAISNVAENSVKTVVTNDSARSKVLAESEARVAEFVNTLNDSKALPSAAKVNEMLRQADVALALTDKGTPAYAEALANRQAIVDNTKNIPGVDQKLQAGPNSQPHGPNCPCCAPGFDKASGADGGKNAPKSVHVVDHGDGSKTVIKTDPINSEPNILTYSADQVKEIEQKSAQTQTEIENMGFSSAEARAADATALMAALNNPDPDANNEKVRELHNESEHVCGAHCKEHGIAPIASVREESTASATIADVNVSDIENMSFSDMLGGDIEDVKVMNPDAPEEKVKIACDGCDGGQGCCDIFNDESLIAKIDAEMESYAKDIAANDDFSKEFENEEPKIGCDGCDGGQGCCDTFNDESLIAKIDAEMEGYGKDIAANDDFSEEFEGLPSQDTKSARSSGPNYQV